jgi:hypothetical protein
MTSPDPSPLPAPEFLEDAIIVAGLAHMTARTPAQRRAAMDRLLQLKAERERLKRVAA